MLVVLVLLSAMAMAMGFWGGVEGLGVRKMKCELIDIRFRSTLPYYPFFSFSFLKKSTISYHYRL